MEPLPGVFNTLQRIETISLLVESLCHDLLNKMKYILWVVVLLEACDVTSNGRHLPRIGNQVKTARNVNFLCFT